MPRTPQIVPYLYYPDAGPAIEFLQEAFGFEVMYAHRSPEGRVLTSRLRLGSGEVMVGPGAASYGSGPIQDADRVPVRMYVYVDEVDSHCEKARAAGARITSEPAVHIGAAKQYVASDPGGHSWIFAQVMEPSPK